MSHVLDEAADVAVGHEAGDALLHVVKKSDRVSEKIRRSEDLDSLKIILDHYRMQKKYRRHKKSHNVKIYKLKKLGLEWSSQPAASEGHTEHSS